MRVSCVFIMVPVIPPMIYMLTLLLRTTKYTTYQMSRSDSPFISKQFSFFRCTILRYINSSIKIAMFSKKKYASSFSTCAPHNNLSFKYLLVSTSQILMHEATICMVTIGLAPMSARKYDISICHKPSEIQSVSF